MGHSFCQQGATYPCKEDGVIINMVTREPDHSGPQEDSQDYENASNRV
jgi:hypothetical protein